MSDYDPGSRPSRAAYKDRYGFRDYQAGQQAVRERREQAMRELRQDHCHHGRSRKVGMNDLRPWAALECRDGKCPALYLTAAEVFTQWRDAGREASA